MLLLGGHGRTNNMGVDVTRNDIFEYTFRNQRWLPVLVDNAQLPRPDARFAHAGGVVDGTDVIEFAGASCLETETGLLCQPAFNDAWAFDMTGRRTIRGSIKGSVVDPDGRAVQVARLVAFSMVRPSLHAAICPTICCTTVHLPPSLVTLAPVRASRHAQGVAEMHTAKAARSEALGRIFWRAEELSPKLASHSLHPCSIPLRGEGPALPLSLSRGLAKQQPERRRGRTVSRAAGQPSGVREGGHARRHIHRSGRG